MLIPYAGAAAAIAISRGFAGFELSKRTHPAQGLDVS